MSDFSRYNRARVRIADVLYDKYKLPDKIIQELLDFGRTDRAMLDAKGWNAAFDATAHNLNLLADEVEHGDYYDERPS